eukprot:2408340-Rhodomonas_salina.1
MGRTSTATADSLPVMAVLGVRWELQRSSWTTTAPRTGCRVPTRAGWAAAPLHSGPKQLPCG